MHASQRIVLAGCLLASALSVHARPQASAAPPAVIVPDTISLAGPDAAAVRTPSAANAWGGPRTGHEATLSDRVVDYRITATLDPVTHQLTGQQKLTWRNRSKVPVRAVYLHLYLNAFRNSGSLFFHEKNELGFEFRSEVPMRDGDWGWIDMTRVAQGGQTVTWHFVHPDGGPKTDMTVVRLDLPQAVAPGASTTLDIDFAARLPRVVARTGWFGTFHLVGQWFPKIAVLELPGERGATAPRWNAHAFHTNSEFYADFGSYDVTLDVPSDYRVGATGELQGKPVTANGRTRHRYVQHDVHDFAWTADRRFAEPLRGKWRGAGSPPVDITVLYPPEYAASAAPALKATQASLDYFSRTLGPYPYRTVTVVIPPFNADEAGGMEYPTFFTASGYAKVPPHSWTAQQLDFVTIHEFGHGYFYGILGSNEFEEPMLDEGLNQYWDKRMQRASGARYDIAPRWLQALGVRLPLADPFAFERLGAALAHPADATGANSWNRLSSRSYGSVYSRTATLMNDLETQLGRPAMARAFAAYYATWKFRHPSIADLQQSLAESTGRPELIARAFEQQVYATGKQDDRVLSLTSARVQPLTGRIDTGLEPELRSVESVDKRIAADRAAWRKAHPKAAKDSEPGAWRTTVVLRREGVTVPQQLVVTLADGSRRNFTWDDGNAWKRVSFVANTRAVSARIDPTQQYLLDASKLDDSRRIKPDASAARRWSADYAALFQTLQALAVGL